MDSEYIGRRILKMKLPGRRQRGRPERREVVLEKMKRTGSDRGS